MRVLELFFGQEIDGGRRVSAGDWRAFLADVVTREFPDGFTVYDSYGQWMDAKSRHLVREPSKVVQIAIPAGQDFAARLAGVTNAYRSRFHQQSVGIIVTQGCGSF